MVGVALLGNYIEYEGTEFNFALLILLFAIGLLWHETWKHKQQINKLSL